MQNNKIRYNRSNGVDINEIHRNVSQELIEITSDKLKLLLTEYLSCINSRDQWHTPLALLVTIILVLTTTSFKPSLGISADSWSAFFLLSALFCFIWLIIAIKNRAQHISIDGLIDKIKNKNGM